MLGSEGSSFARRSAALASRSKLFAADATTLLVERKAELSFVHDQSLELELRLDSACVDHQCPDDQTCIEGQCKSDAVSADMLTHTGSGAIGGPHDGGVELDLSAGPTQAQDMSHGTQDMPHGTPDLAGCLPVPLPPANANMMGCTYFDFSTTQWMSLGPQITQPTASVTWQNQVPAERPVILGVPSPAGVPGLQS